MKKYQNNLFTKNNFESFTKETKQVRSFDSNLNLLNFHNFTQQVVTNNDSSNNYSLKFFISLKFSLKI